ERLSMSQEWARSAHTDYDEAEQYFVTAAEHNPTLIAQLRKSRNPAKFAYDVGKQAKLIAEIGTDPEAYRRRVREQIIAEMGQQAATTQETPATAPNVVPQPPKSLATKTSTAPRASKALGDEAPTPLEEIFK